MTAHTRKDADAGRAGRESTQTVESDPVDAVMPVDAPRQVAEGTEATPERIGTAALGESPRGPEERSTERFEGAEAAQERVAAESPNAEQQHAVPAPREPVDKEQRGSGR